MVPGQAFSPTNERSAHVRAAFSVASAADMDEALRRLALLLAEA
jgi:DNA-binding transcriptional MocR family regulator